MNSTSKSSPSFGVSHLLVLALGLLVFVLLLFADKTNLKDDNASPMGSPAARAADPEATAGGGTVAGADLSVLNLLPPAQPQGDLALALTALETVNNPEERESLLKDIVNGYRESGRPDVAAVYAGALADQSPSLSHRVVAGALYRTALQMPAVQADSNLVKRFSATAIGYLQAAVAEAPEDEGAKIELGLAMIASPEPGNSMQGIFTIREVADANPQNTEALFHLGRFSMDTGQFDKAEQRFRQILEVEPDNVRAKYSLGMAVRSLGNSAEFNQIMSEVAQQQQDPELAAAAKAALNQ